MENNEKYTKTMRAFFVACNAKGLTEEDRRAMISGYGHQHANEMTTEELQDALYRLNQRADTEDGEHAKWVRRAMAVTYKYLIHVAGVNNPSSNYCKEVITTSQRGVSFNQLDKAQLTKAFYLFKKKYDDHCANTPDEKAEAGIA